MRLKILSLKNIKTICFSIFLSLAFTLHPSPIYAQITDFSFQSKDSLISAGFSHDEAGVIMTFSLANASKFEYIKVMRSMNSRAGFKACHYVKLGNGINNSMTIVERDKFAIPASEDAFYIVEAVMTNGRVLTSPVIRLPKVQGPS